MDRTGIAGLFLRAAARCVLSSGAVLRAGVLLAGTRELAAPSVKQRLAAIRHLFDWLVTGQVVPRQVRGEGDRTYLGRSALRITGSCRRLRA
jgi:hypothetical protein